VDEAGFDDDDAFVGHLGDIVEDVSFVQADDEEGQIDEEEEQEEEGEGHERRSYHRSASALDRPARGWAEGAGGKSFSHRRPVSARDGPAEGGHESSARSSSAGAYTRPVFS